MKTSTVIAAVLYRKSLRIWMAFGCVIIGAMTSSMAQSIWSGAAGDGKWSTSSNWNTAPTNATSTVVQFAGSTSTAVDVDSAVSVRSITFNSGASSFVLSDSAISLTGAATGELTLVNSSTNLQTVNNALTITSGGISASNGDMQINGTVTVAGSGGFRLAAGAGKVLTISGAMAGSITGDSFSVNAAGGTVVLNNALSTNTGGFNVWQGTVIANGNSVSDYATASIFGKNGAVGVGVSSGTANASVLTGGSYTMANSFRINSNASSSVVYTLGGNTAALSTFSGVVKLGSISGAAKGVSVTAASGGRVNFTGGIVRESTATGTGDTLTKVGAGVVALYGSNSYSGVTTVSSGALLINGTLTAAISTGTVSVVSGATLGGNGTIVRNVSVADNANFTVGDMDLSGNSLVGTLTIGESANAASLVFSSASILNFDLGSTSNYDKVVINGGLTLDGVLNVNALSGFGVGTYTLFTYTAGSLQDLGLTYSSTINGFSVNLDTTTDGVVKLNVVPEPDSAPLLISAMAFLAVCCWRRGSRLANA